MYNINRTYIFKNLYSKIYILKKLGTKEDDNHNEVPYYSDNPMEFRWNVQTIKDESEQLEFGENASKMKVATIPFTEQYQNKFDEFDLAYLDNATPDNEVIRGQNANYRIYAVRPQNNIIKIYFLKLTK